MNPHIPHKKVPHALVILLFHLKFSWRIHYASLSATFNWLHSCTNQELLAVIKVRSHYNKYKRCHTPRGVHWLVHEECFVCTAVCQKAYLRLKWYQTVKIQARSVLVVIKLRLSEVSRRKFCLLKEEKEKKSVATFGTALGWST